uniref:PAQR family membrane homeostasis protein TrhA n=1 Tax=Ningiella ruwaisensis TaxID=2364274 RepID=UPI00109F1890|nr:hemolysin III family protein [Ningiella ruwaisensis]
MLPKKSKDSDLNAYLRSEEWINSLTHALGALLGVAGLILLLLASNDVVASLTAVVYGLSLVAMFTASALYHISIDEKKRRFLRKVDHISIYLLIAGSYTPFLVLAVKGFWGWLGLGVIWSVAIAGITFKLLFGYKYPKISVYTYAIMGWLALFLIYPIYQALDLTGFILLLAGGLSYSAGIPLYMLKSRHYSHALWHLCVVAGAACHFFAIYVYVY